MSQVRRSRTSPAAVAAKLSRLKGIGGQRESMLREVLRTADSAILPSDIVAFDFHRPHRATPAHLVADWLNGYDSGVDGGAAPGSYVLDLSAIGFSTDAEWPASTIIVISITKGGNTNSIVISTGDVFNVSGTGTFTLSGAESITRASGLLTLVTSAQSDYSGSTFLVTAFVSEPDAPSSKNNLGINGLHGNGSTGVGSNTKVQWSASEGSILLPTPIASDVVYSQAINLSAVGLIADLWIAPLVNDYEVWSNDLLIEWAMGNDPSSLSFNSMLRNNVVNDLLGEKWDYWAKDAAGLPLAGSWLVVKFNFGARTRTIPCVLQGFGVAARV